MPLVQHTVRSLWYTELARDVFKLLGCSHHRRRCRRHDVRRHRRAARAARAADRALRRRSEKKSASRAADAAISRTSSTRPESFISENPQFARSALARYTPLRLHRARAQAPDCLSREAQRVSSSVTAVPSRSLRCCGRNATRAMFSGEFLVQCSRFNVTGDGFSLQSDAGDFARAARRDQPPAECRFRRLARATTVTKSRANSACASSSRARRWCPLVFDNGCVAAVLGDRRCFARGARARGAGQLRRGSPLHASRPVGPGDPADLEFLESAPTDSDRPRYRR